MFWRSAYNSDYLQLYNGTSLTAIKLLLRAREDNQIAFQTSQRAQCRLCATLPPAPACASEPGLPIFFGGRGPEGKEKPLAAERQHSHLSEYLRTWAGVSAEGWVRQGWSLSSSTFLSQQ